MISLKTYRQPLLLISGCLIAGIIAGKYILSLQTAVWLAVFFTVTAMFFRWWNRTPASDTAILLLLVLAGTCRFHLTASGLPENHITRYLSSDILAVQGMIDDVTYKRDGRDRYIVCAESLIIAGKRLSAQGKILLQTRKLSQRFVYGDRLYLNVPLQIPANKNTPGQFDYRSYLRARDIYATMVISPADSIHLLSRQNGNFFVRQIIVPIRDYSHRVFVQNLSGQTASLLHALILGEKQDLDVEMTSRFQKVGIVHILAISGLHVGFIIAFVFAALSLFRIGQPLKITLLVIILIVYIVLIRFKTPVIRASVMSILLLSGQLLERKSSIINNIFAALTIILLFDPRELFQPGFQFSFAAVFSIVYGYDKLNRLFMPGGLTDHSFSWQKYIRKWVWMPFLVSVSAVTGTLPLSLYYYGLIPVYAIFANLIVIPLTGLIVFLSLFLLLLQPLGQLFAGGLGRMIQLLHGGLELVANYFADLPLASIITVIPDLYQMILLYVGIFVFFNYQSFRRPVWVTLLTMLLILTGLSFCVKDRNGMQISFIDVGQGDAAFLKFPNGRTMLIDGGNTSQYWDNGSRVLLPFLQATGNLHLDYLVGSHAHNDHIGGFIYLLDNLKIDTLVLSPYHYTSVLYRQLHKRSEAGHVAIKIVVRGDQLFPDKNCRMYILHPDSQFARAENHSGSECNNSSLVMKLQYGENAVLFTGDLELQGEQPVLDYGDFLESEIIKIGHHGSLTSTSEKFLNQINPIAAVISVGEKNKFKHPSPRTLERLHSYGLKLFLTSKQGTINLILEPDKITRVYR